MRLVPERFHPEPTTLRKRQPIRQVLGALLAAGLSLGAEETTPPLVIPIRPAEIAPVGAAQATLDLKEVLERAGRANLDVRVSSSRADAADGERLAARARYWPSLGLGALGRRTDGTLQGTFGDLGRATFDTALLNALVRWDLNPGAAHFESRAAAEAAAAAGDEVEATRLEAQMTAATEYLELVGAAALVTVARQSESDAEEFLRLTRALEEKGLGLGVDVQRARAEAARRAQARAAAEEALVLASSRLAVSLDLDPTVTIVPRDEAVSPPALPAPEPLADLVARALCGRPEIRIAARDVAAAEARLTALRWDAFGPGLSVEAQRGSIGTALSEMGERSIYEAQLGWTLRPRAIAELHTARARLETARLREERTRQGIRSEVVQARQSVELARQRLGQSREALDAADRALSISRTRFAGGLGSSLEVLQAQDASAAARAEAVSVLVEAHRAVLALRRALGGSLDAP